MKSKDNFLRAIINGSIVNIETHRELEWLRDLSQEKTFKVGLRLSINISHISGADADGDNDFSRFGFNDETNEFKDAIAFIDSLANVSLSGLHLHRTAHSRSVRFYKRLTEYAASVIQKYDLNLEYLDLGGGYYGIFKNAPTFNDYADAIYNVLSTMGLDKMRIIVEPGNALTASAFTFYMTVIDTKRLPNCKIVTTDGSRTFIDPFFKKSRYLSTNIYVDECERGIEPLQVVCGATCLEYDKLYELVDSPELKVGDIIRCDNTGAYTLTLTPLFINFFPRVYALNGDNLRLMREKWTAKEMIQKSVIE